MANRPVTGAKIMYPAWPFITCRPRLCHCRYPATRVGNGSGTLPASNAASCCTQSSIVLLNERLRNRAANASA